MTAEEVDKFAVIEWLYMQYLETPQRKAAVVVVDLGMNPLGQDQKLINDVFALADSAQW